MVLYKRVDAALEDALHRHVIWCCSDQIWDAHLQRKHVELLKDDFGSIKECGVVVVAAHCIFCL
jgi:hypothetical protein